MFNLHFIFLHPVYDEKIMCVHMSYPVSRQLISTFSMGLCSGYPDTPRYLSFGNLRCNKVICAKYVATWIVDPKWPLIHLIFLYFLFLWHLWCNIPFPKFVHVPVWLLYNASTAKDLFTCKLTNNRFVTSNVSCR